jgi:hypothetical protein
MSEYQDPVRQAVEDYLTQNSSVISAVAAKELIDTVLPRDVLQEWLWGGRYETLTAFITHVCRMSGARDARDRQKGVFADEAAALADAIAEAEASGTPLIHKLWHCSNADGKPVRKRLGDMNATEVRFVQNRAANSIRYYERRVRFLELVAERLGEGQVVSDLYSADQLQALLDSIN